MPVPKPNIGTTFIPRVELVIEEAQLQLRWEASPFDGSVNGQAIVWGNYRPVLCNVGPYKVRTYNGLNGSPNTNLHSAGFFNPACWKWNVSFP